MVAYGDSYFWWKLEKKWKEAHSVCFKTIVSKPSSNIFWESTTNGMVSEIKKSQT